MRRLQMQWANETKLVRRYTEKVNDHYALTTLINSLLDFRLMLRRLRDVLVARMKQWAVRKVARASDQLARAMLPRFRKGKNT